MQAEQFKQRILSMSEAIRRFQKELEQLNLEAAEQGENCLVIEKFLGPETLIHLKESVDNLRQYLQGYLETAARESSRPGVEYALQSYRIQRIAEMLRSLQHEQAPARSFFERMHTIAENAMEKHARTGTPEQ